MSVTHQVKTPNNGLKTVQITRGQAIKGFCTECMGFEGNPSDCTAPTCFLYPFRGKTYLAYDGEMNGD